MGHLVEWDNEEKTVVFQRYTGVPTKDDLYHLAKESSDMLQSVSHTVHLIIDENNVKFDLNLTDMNYLEKNVPSNQGSVIMIVNKHHVNYKKSYKEICEKIAPLAFGETYFTTSLEEARELLKQAFGVYYP